MSKNTGFVILFLFLSILAVQSQGTDISLSVTPGVEIPFGPLSSEGEQMYSFGGSVSLTGEIPFSSESVFFGTGLVDFGLISTTADTSISIISLGMGAGINYDPVLKTEFQTICSRWLGIRNLSGNYWKQSTCPC